MTVTVASFRAAYPEFTSTSDALIARYIDEAALWVGSHWGDDQDKGVMYYVAHTAQGEIDGTETGGTTSIGSGSHKVTVSGANGKDRWNNTRYGRLFWLLMQRYAGHRIYAV